MIRLFSIEDHWMVIHGLHSTFRDDRDDMSITCSAETIEEALSVDTNLFDIILLDLLIPNTDPIENVIKLKNKFPGKPIVILTSEDRSVWEDQMCESGVQAYLTKHDKRKVIKSVIKRVSMGEDLCKERMLEFTQNANSTNPKNLDNILKPSEIAILTLYSQELSLKEISAKMFRTESAISKVMAKLRKQFNVKSNLGLIRVFMTRKMS